MSCSKRLNHAPDFHPAAAFTTIHSAVSAYGFGSARTCSRASTRLVSPHAATRVPPPSSGFQNHSCSFLKAIRKFLQQISLQSLLGLRWSLGAVFCLAGFLKISDPIGFHADLLAYELPMPDVVSRLVAVVFPCLELICGVGLIIGFWRESVSLLALTMSSIFVLMLVQAMVRGLDLNCGCFGSARGHWFNLPSIALVRAFIMLWASFWLYRRKIPAPLASANPKI